MKKWLLIFMSSASLYIFAVDNGIAQSGEVIEALFIAQNKLKEVLEHIQWLKKELTECSVACVKEKKARNRKKFNTLSIQEYHCELKHLIFPGLIEELEALAVPIATGIDLLSKDGPIEQKSVARVVGQAFLLKDRVEIERQLLSLLFLIDKLESEKRHSLKLKELKYDLKRLRRSLENIKSELYQDKEIKTRTFIEKLETRKGY